MAYPKLHVVFYRPRYGNYQHWALYLQTGTEHVIFEVTGSHPVRLVRHELKRLS
jgi:hypothetical protein